MIAMAFVYLEQQIVAQDGLSGVSTNTWLTLAAAVVGSSAFGYAGKSWFDRNVLRATAKKEEASAADIVAKAATELVDPLRLELTTTRKELADTRAEVRALTTEMHKLNIQLDSQQTRNEQLEARNTALERENAELKQTLANGNGEKK